MSMTDIFIKRPVLAIVISLFILVLGIRSIGSLSVQQYPTVQSAVITVNTAYTGADPATIAAFITTPLETAIAQANGIDYMTSSSAQNVSMVQANLLLNYDPDKALTEINTQVGTVLNQLPQGSQLPTIQVSVAQSIASMYLGFYSDVLKSNQINDYLLRTVQPQVQAVHGVQQAQILGNNQFALRVWINPRKLAGYHLTFADVANILRENNFVSAAGRTDGTTFILNLTSDTALTEVKQFSNMVIKAEKGAIIRIKDIGKVSLGSQNYNTTVTYNGKQAVYIGITVAPNANLLTVLNGVRKVFYAAQEKFPKGLNGTVVYDAGSFVTSSITEVIETLIEAFIIVSIVVFFFLGDFSSVLIPVIAIPLSIIGTFFVMLMLGYTINLLTLLALVLAIGLVVDDAIIVVENVHRHIEDGVDPFKASLMSARELTQPIIAIAVVLIAVYLPIGFMGGLTGALFTEFAFTLAGAVAVSSVVALTLSPMLCSRYLKPANTAKKKGIMAYISSKIDDLGSGYAKLLHKALKILPVVIVFAVIILVSNVFLFATSQSELAPQEDQGIIMTQLTAAANSSIAQTGLYTQAVSKIFDSFPETQNTFQINGTSGVNNAPSLNLNVGGMVLKPWDKRKKTTNQLQPIIQQEVLGIAGGKVAAFQPPSLPGGGAGLPIQFVVQTTDPFTALNPFVQKIIKEAKQTGDFLFIDPDLKIDQAQTTIKLNRNKVSEFGLTMKQVGASLSAALSENYVNYFNYMGRSYQVIPQVNRQFRLNDKNLLDYYVNTQTGQTIPLATFATIQHTIVPESINHFQQLNSATISAVPAPGVSMGKALDAFKTIADKVLPPSYNVNYAGQSRQYIQESSSLITTFFLALIIIYLALAVLFNSFRDPLIVLISVPMSICGAMIFVSMGVHGVTLNIYTEVGLVTLICLISKHGILIVQFANDLQLEGKNKLEAVSSAAAIRFRPILMTTGAMVLGVVPLLVASGAGAVSRFAIGLVISTGLAIGTLFTLFVVPAMYALIAEDLSKKNFYDSDSGGDSDPA